jgi:hypothetical protein
MIFVNCCMSVLLDIGESLAHTGWGEETGLSLLYQVRDRSTGILQAELTARAGIVDSSEPVGHKGQDVGECKQQGKEDEQESVFAHCSFCQG